MADTTCPVCDDEFDTAGALSHHSWDAHSACQYCGDELTTKDELYVHWLATHEGELTRGDRKRVEAEVDSLSFGNRLAHQGPVGAVRNTRLSRRQLLGGGAALAVAGIGGVAGTTLFGSSASPGEARTGASAPKGTFTTLSGDTGQVSEFQRQKRMVWLFATWCPSCKQGARALQNNMDQLGEMQIIGVKTAGNAGYEGPSVREFVQSFAPSLLDADSWTWGTASQAMTNTYNPQNQPDIYYLVDQDGTIQTQSTAPAATIDRIVEFAQTATSGTDRPGTSYDIQPAEHIQPGADHPPYNSNPPTSGWHYPQQAAWDFYTEELPDERVVHNLEHGGIWIAYTNVSATPRSKLREIAKEYPQSVIVTQRSANDAPIAVASWGQLMELQSFDRPRIVEFIEQNRNHSPEPVAGQ
jgi:thiol-disulfide isomerase/thioredoxin